LIPGIDDGPSSWEETLAMARIALADGVETIVATPHQLGYFPQNGGECIRRATRQLASFLRNHNVPLRVLPGADVRIEAEMVPKIRRGSVVSLADRGMHVLLELPHELYFCLRPLLDQLHEAGIRGVLSHPERNQGLLAKPDIISRLVTDGCLMQITAGSFLGTFGPACQQLSEWMLHRGLVHFVASDAHGPKARRPRLRRAYCRVAQLAGRDTAVALFCDNPASVVEGRDVAGGRQPTRARGLSRWLGRAAAAG
jgi:protein-tyrosine phosphatase